jgi:hypothetical protein
VLASEEWCGLRSWQLQGSPASHTLNSALCHQQSRTLALLSCTAPLQGCYYVCFAVWYEREHAGYLLV